MILGEKNHKKTNKLNTFASLSAVKFPCCGHTYNALYVVDLIISCSASDINIRWISMPFTDNNDDNNDFECGLALNSAHICEHMTTLVFVSLNGKDTRTSRKLNLLGTFYLFLFLHDLPLKSSEHL